MPEKNSNTRYRLFLLLPLLCCMITQTMLAQQNLLLNGDFEDINTCSEYTSECGVEGWFYLRDVKAQMFANENNTPGLGNNSFAIFFPWTGYTGFAPVLGTLLPCGLQKGKQYSFKGMIQARLDNRLILQAGIAMGEKFYVPQRPFVSTMIPDTIEVIKQVDNTNFYSFNYNFVATGNEKYLTFGTFIKEDTVGAKRALIGNKVISITLDNFELVSSDKDEVVCSDFLLNKEKIYRYDSRHKEMDNNLYAKGELPLRLTTTDTGFITRKKMPQQVQYPKTDTLNLGDVFFDFNKAVLKPAAINMLDQYFRRAGDTRTGIDSIYVDGHTDSVGSESKNMLLSKDRCESIKNWLLQHSVVSEERVIVRPFGKSKPVATNATAEGRAINRRVQLIVFRVKDKS